MSELIHTNLIDVNFRWRLLTSVSAVVLLAAITFEGEARASDESNRPTVWLEFGGQLEKIQKEQDTFVAPFLLGPQPPGAFPFAYRYSFGPAVPFAPPDAPFDRSQPLQAQKPPRYSVGGSSKIFFQPGGTDWVFSASVQYGRANGHKTDKQQTANRMPYAPYLSRPQTIGTPSLVRFSNARADYSESHVVLDFQAGKDVGLGLFGHGASSQFNVGVRFAQFISKSAMNIKADPYLQVYSHHYNGFLGSKYHFGTRFHSYALAAHSERSFHGIGPSISWNASTPLASNPEIAEFTLDWGVNAAVLFGRQKAQADHKTTAFDRYKMPAGVYNPNPPITQYKHSVAIDRRRAVVSPNLGGFAGVSLKFPNARVSLGYRADFFFNAMDAGIDSRNIENVSFHGPFAKISIGLGG